ncbi:hypothetical protein CROQUDRAFT_144740 [Cronartium quercuum f. sp. fusiforme G11]|uniref:Uncharacterized protein n=1 Tax=Cronartium quercuum f. sp. fusiforme G11 TaxID=708437 RepID=A0A9P6NZQ0_9BASI|nr:hypothetical protein CROQUDRAFT_144740 [Cronartium quercuum f. sp. fusiforme G11]
MSGHVPTAKQLMEPMIERYQFPSIGGVSVTVSSFVLCSSGVPALRGDRRSLLSDKILCVRRGCDKSWRSTSAIKVSLLPVTALSSTTLHTSLP